MVSSLLSVLALAVIAPADVSSPHQATGVKVGEVTTDSARIWVRLTANPQRKSDGIVRRGKPVGSPADRIDVNQLEGSCPGMAGKVRVRYGTGKNLADARAMDWVSVDEKTDFAHVFKLTGLKPATEYYFASETQGQNQLSPNPPLLGSFATAPLPDTPAKVTFVVVTGGWPAPPR